MKSCFDTDKAFHMSFDEVTFNADRIRSKLELLSEELMPRCGLVYELYQRRLSAAIDNFVATLPTEQHLLVLELAREEFDYLSAEEIAEEIRRDSERGYCYVMALNAIAVLSVVGIWAMIAAMLLI